MHPAKNREYCGPHSGGIRTVPGSAAIVTSDVSNVTIKNGRIAGFGTGIRLASSLAQGRHACRGCAYRRQRLDRDLRRDRHGVIRNNRITNLDGTLQGATSSGPVAAIYAENVWGSRMGVEIRNNWILGLKGTAGSTAITLFRAPATIVEGSTIAGLNSDAFTGVRIGHSNGVTIANNRFSTLLTGIDYQYDGVGKYYGNITESVGRPYIGGGTNLGNNF